MTDLNCTFIWLRGRCHVHTTWEIILQPNTNFWSLKFRSVSCSHLSKHINADIWFLYVLYFFQSIKSMHFFYCKLFLKYLFVPVPPRIHFVSSNGRVEVKKGTSIRLECKASGNPVPKITWSRRNNLLPGGEQTMVTPVLTLNSVDRHQAGVYQCTASNGVGEDVTQQIVLHVLCKRFRLLFLFPFK